MGLRIGIGHDTHRLGADRPLIIGGVVVPHSSGLEGHSDADVLLHALTDAILGAASRGDIGEWFPDTDPANKDRSSVDMLQRVLSEVLAPGDRLVNIDCTVFAQEPKLGPYKQTIRDSLARLLPVRPNVVNVKAKTGEKVGHIGRGEAIAAQVAVLIDFNGKDPE